MTLKHTPGPWECARSATPEWSYQATIYVDGGGFKRVAMAFESEANARLISAAPDLLAALIELRDAPWLNLPGRAGDIVEAAINKATKP